MSEMIIKPNRILQRQFVVNDYKIRMSRSISQDADDFEEEFELLAQAGPHDSVTIDIVSGGGDFDTGHQICRAIRSCAADVTAYIGPTCASMGTAIALACDNWEIDDYSSFMIHTVIYGHGGQAPHVRANVDHNDKMIERFIRNTYAGFLSEDEILKVLDGKELYFEGEDLANRLVSFKQHRDALEQALELDEGEEEE